MSNAAARYSLTRGKFGSPILYDDVERRPVLVALRHTEIVPEAADAAAMRMLRVCQQALNRVDSEHRWAAQQEAGKR